jgi:hypothetical protein
MMYELQQRRQDQQNPFQRFGWQREDEWRELAGQCRKYYMYLPCWSLCRLCSWAREISDQIRPAGDESYTTCYTRHAPQSICAKWEPNSRGGYQRMGQDCSMPAQLIHGPMRSAIWAPSVRAKGLVDIDNCSTLATAVWAKGGWAGG